MVEMRVRRVFLADTRGNDQYLRATWHPETAVVVVSHWVGEVCVASTPVGVADASKLIELLVAALQDTADAALQDTANASRTAAVVPVDPPRSRAATVFDRLRGRLRPMRAQIIALRRPDGPVATDAARDPTGRQPRQPSSAERR